MPDSPASIAELPIPDAVGAAGWDDFRAMCAVRNACESAAYGMSEMAVTPEDMLAVWGNLRFDPKRLFVARLDGRVVARAVVETTADDEPFAWLKVEVLPEARGRGIGTALSDHAEAVARADGRTRFIVYAASPPADGEHVSPPTGFGSVPRSNPEVRFLLRRGYALEQVERGSRLALPADPERLERAMADAAAHTASDYRTHTWTGATPTPWQADLAVLCTRMSTDAPTAGLEEPEDVWSVERIVAEDERRAASTQTPVTSVVEHVPSGRLVGFTVLLVPDDATRAVVQDDTLVLREHRGHRLGMLLKARNLLRLAEAGRRHPSVITFNAEENRPMLDVNEALGFAPIGYEGAWRRDEGA